MTRHLRTVKPGVSGQTPPAGVQAPNNPHQGVRSPLKALEVVGVDPGEAATGVVTRRGNDVAAQQVIRSGRIHGGRHVIVSHDYLAQVLAAVNSQVVQSVRRTGQLPALAIEGLNAPSPHMGTINPRTLIASGVVLGAVLGLYGHPIGEPLVERVVIVPPGSHGSQPVAAYPQQLSSPAERKRGPLHVAGGNLRHARSAFDVAGAARHPALTSGDANYGA